jgi:RHS repeat-associated protein
MRVTTHTEPINQAVIVNVEVPMLSRLFTYRSDWSSGRRASYKWAIPGLEPGRELQINVAGRSEPATADVSGVATFIWDGLDSDGTVVGVAMAVAEIDGEVRRVRLGRWSPMTVGLGGLMISPYDHLDAQVRRVHTSRGRLKGNIGWSATDGGYVVTKSSGRLISRFDVDGFLTEVVEAESGQPQVTFRRDDGGLSSIHGLNRETSISRSTDSIVVRENGWELQLATDEAGRVVSITDPSQRGTQLSYSESGLLSHLIDASGFDYQYEYDDDGRLVGVTNPGEGRIDLVRKATEHGHRVSMISAEGRESYQQVERLPDGTKVRTSKCCGDHPSTTTITADRIQVDRPDGTRVLKDKTGSGTRQLIVPSGLTHTRSAEEGRIVVNEQTYLMSSESFRSTTVSPMGKTFKLEETGTSVQITKPNGTAELHKDDLGRVQQIKEGSTAVDVAYGPDGLISALTWSDGSSTSFEHDKSGWLTAQHYPDNRKVSLERDGSGLVRAVVPPGSEPTAFEFAAPGKLRSILFPSSDEAADSIEFEYDRDGLMVSRRVSGRPPITFQRGVGGEVERIASGEWHSAFEYEGGLPSKASGVNQQEISFSYDGSLLKGIEYSGATKGALSYRYDRWFRVDEVRAGNLAIESTYDADGLLESNGPASLQRDETGKITSIEAGVVVQAFTYGPDGTLSRMSLSVGRVDVWSVDYTYDTARRIASMIDSQAPDASPVEFHYDSARRLVRSTGAESFELSYDANGNMQTVERGSTVVEATTDTGDRLRTLDDYLLNYDSGGAVIERTRSGQSVSFRRDAMGLVTEVHSNSSTTLERDPYGLLTGLVHEGLGETRLLNGRFGRPEAVVSGDGAVQALFGGGSRSATPLLCVEEARILFIASDHVGSVRFIVDIDSGEIVEQERFDSWGSSVFHQGGSMVPYGFAGGLRDRHNGLVHFPARTYDPALMRWLSRDPLIFLGGSSNLYAYANNDPINFRDPSGQKVEVCRRPTSIVPIPGAEHHWIRTSKREAGMGGDPAVRGGVLPNAVVIDHTGQGDIKTGEGAAQCDPVDDVDEDCVDRYLETNKIDGDGDRYGKWLGMYRPGNICQDFVDDVLSACSGGDYSIETDNPDAYDKFYGPDYRTHAPPSDSPSPDGSLPETPVLDYTPDPGQSTLDNGALWE